MGLRPARSRQASERIVYDGDCHHHEVVLQSIKLTTKVRVDTGNEFVVHLEGGMWLDRCDASDLKAFKMALYCRQHASLI